MDLIRNIFMFYLQVVKVPKKKNSGDSCFNVAGKIHFNSLNTLNNADLIIFLKMIKNTIILIIDKNEFK